MPNLPNWNTGSWGTGYGGNPVPSMFVPQQYANLSSLEAMFPGPSPFTVPGASLPPNTAADYAALRNAVTQSQVLNQYATNFEPLNPSKPSGLFSRPQPATNGPLPTRTPGTPGSTYANLGGNPAGATPPPPNNIYANAAAKGANRVPFPNAGPGARAGAAAGGAQPTGSAPTNPYSAFKGVNPLNVRGALSPTGSVGSKLPGVLTANRGFGPSPTGAVGSRLPGIATRDLASLGQGGKFTKFGGMGANMAAGLGAMVAMNAIPQWYANARGADPNSYGVKTSRDVSKLASWGLLGGPAVAGSVGLGVGIADAAASTDFVRDEIINRIRGWMPGGGWAPTDSTVGESLANLPGFVGDWFGDGGPAGGEQAQDPVAALPPTVESIATVGQMAGLDPSSTGFLQEQFNNSVLLSMAQYTADPEGFKKQFESVHGRPMESEADISQVLFSKIVGESLPLALESQSAQAAALQNAAMYQDFISKYMAPIRDQYNDLGARASAAGYGDLALQFQGQGVSQESAIRMIPSLEALRAKQAQVDQLAQQQWQASVSGTGGTGADPLGDAATLDALMAAAG